MIQEALNFENEDVVDIYAENFENESNNSKRIITSPKIITPETTTPVLNISTTPEKKESAINVTNVKLPSLESKSFGNSV